MRPLIFATVAIFMTGCASDPSFVKFPRTGELFDIGYTYEDVPAQGIISLNFHNESRDGVCLDPEFWPSNGILLNNGTQVSIDIGSDRLFLNAEQDLCLKCTIRVAPGETAQGYFRYSSFGVGSDRANQAKILNFKSRGYNCGSGE